MTPPSANGPNKTALRALISGRVQGVGYRFSTREQARRLGLAGWVRNLSDGRVEAWIEGERSPVENMVDWLHQGPPAASVNNVDIEKMTAQQHHSFEILR